MDILPQNHTLHPPLQIPNHVSSLTTPPYISTILNLLLLPLTLLTIYYIHKDYTHFLSLGPGGTPSTPLGYLKIKALSLICLRDPLSPIPIPPHYRPQKGYLSSLPQRKGSRPLVEGIAPQRQQTEKSSPEVYNTLVASMRSLARRPENKLLERTSCFEKHSSGLFSTKPITRVCGGEICHAHPSDGSLHMTLHPHDSRILIERGWGERHPLARGGWCRRFVPKEFVLVYAPRDEEEVRVVMSVVAASVWWVSGMDVFEREKGVNRRGSLERMGGEALEGRQAGKDECWSCRMHGCGKRGDKMVSRA